MSRKSNLATVPQAPGQPTYEEIVIEGVKFQARTGDPGAGVPKPRPYVYNKKQLQEISIGIRRNMNILLTGPTGCGKTSIVSALASATKMPLVRFNCDGETRVSNLRGMMKPTSQEGVLSLVFSPGDMALAMEMGWWVLLDEIDAALPSVLFVLQPVLEEDRRELHLPEMKRTITAHPDFRIFATGNTVGFRASHRARHSGTNPMNAAFIDRFGIVIDCDYPSKDDEIARICANIPELQDSNYGVVVESIARAAELIRQDQRVKADFSTRRCIQWARLFYELEQLEDPFAEVHSAEMSVVRKLENPQDAQVVREIIYRVFGYNDEEIANATKLRSTK